MKNAKKIIIIGILLIIAAHNAFARCENEIYTNKLRKNYDYITNAFKKTMKKNKTDRLSNTVFWLKMQNVTTPSTLALDPKLKKEFFRIFKKAKIYEGAKIPDKDIVVNYKNLTGHTLSNIDPMISQGAIELKNGAYLYLSFSDKPINAEDDEGNPYETLAEFQSGKNTPTKLWQHIGDIIIDVNGKKPPNIMGRDLFWFILGNDGNLYPLHGKDYAMYYAIECKYDNINNCILYYKNRNNNFCNPQKINNSKNGDGCAARIIEENWNMNY